MAFLSVEQEDAAADKALAVLKMQPGWASVQERISQANVSHLRQSKQPANLQEGRDAALTNLDFQGQTYLDLVSDSATADAYCSVLPLLVRTAYVRYCGQPRQVANPVSLEAHHFEREVESRAQEWTNKAYRRAQDQDTSRRGLKGASRIGRQSRYEIEQFATDAFKVARDRIVKEHADKKNAVLAQLGRMHNSGGYLLALTKWGAGRLREMILAQADAYVEAFTIHGVPSDLQAEKTLETTSMELAAGTISGIRGELDLMTKRTRKPRTASGGHLNREINHAKGAALDEGKLRLQRQRIRAKMRQNQPSTTAEPTEMVASTVVEPSTALGKETMGKTGFWGDIESRFRALQRGDGPYARWAATPAGDEWHIGGADQNTREKFRWAAERAAVELGQSAGRAAVFFWLDLLRRDSPDYAGYSASDGSEHGKIKRVCVSSADYCIKLESQDVAAKSAAKRDQGTALPDLAKPLIRTYIEKARSKVSAVAKELTANTKTLEQAASELELEARDWGQNLRNAILEDASLTGLSPDDFDKVAALGAEEIPALAAGEFAMISGVPAADGPNVFVDTRTSIIRYLEEALVDYPQQYRKQNLSVFKLSQSSVRSEPRRRPGKQAKVTDFERVKQEIRDLREAKFSHEQICDRLGNKPRPRNAAWSHLRWPGALKDPAFRNSVKSWLSRQ